MPIRACVFGLPSSLALALCLAACGNAPSGLDGSAAADLANAPGSDGPLASGGDLAQPASPPDQMISAADLASADAPHPDLAPVPVSCTNGIKDGSETDVDCGGTCPACALGKACNVAGDCQSHLCLNLVCSTAMMGKTQFSMPVAFTVGLAPVQVATGDFNADGKLDLAVPNQGMFGKTSTVSVLLGKGDGTFGTAANVPAGYNPTWVAVGDWNGDGRADMAVANQGSGMNPGSLGVYLAGVGGAFATFTTVPLTGSPGCVVTGDVNGDKKPDLVVLSVNAGAPGTAFSLLGKGAGAFAAPVTVAVGDVPAQGVLADLNGDKDLDLVVANGGDFNGPSDLTLNTGDGTGAFAAPKVIAPGPGVDTFAIADFNGDGAADVAVLDTTSGSPVLAVLLSNDNGSFQPAKTTPLKGNDYRGTVSADFNSDGVADLAIIFSSGTVAVFIGNGDGTFQASADFAATANLHGQAITAGDFNGDKKPDLAVVDLLAGAVVILLNTSM